MKVHRFVLPEDQVRDRLDRVLACSFPHNSRASLQRWIEEGRVTVDGGPCRSRDRVRPGQVIEVVPAAPPPTHAVPDGSVGFSVLFEDEHLIVIDKPAGLVVHPAKGHHTGTLVNGLVARYGWDWAESEPTDPAEAIRPGIVHRIDKDTSGILVVARSERARNGLKEQLAAHEMGRCYLAMTVGAPPDTTIRSYYGRHPRSRLKFTSLLGEGKVAITHVQVIERFGNGIAALVECRLETGRTHQIRVHMAEQLRTPLLADRVYGCRVQAPTLIQAESLIGRQALHAARLAFTHPVSGKSLEFSVDPPQDFRNALDYLRGMKAL